jgi:DNA-binding PadR family transcriptional regulator
MGDIDDVRLTHQSLKVLALFIEDRKVAMSGADLIKRLNLASGTVYPILMRFEQAGILTSDWEEGKAKHLGRPRKRLYRITPDGVTYAARVLRDLRDTVKGISVWGRA